MPAVDPIARVLLELIGKQYVLRSAVGVRTRSAIEPLFHAGALREIRSGAGWRIVVDNLDAVRVYAESAYPQGLETEGGRFNRSESVARFRNAKRGANFIGEPVLIRGFSDAPLVSPQGDLDVCALTKLCGTAVFVISDERHWVYKGGRVALVENLEPFLRFEDRFKDFDAAIYCAGRMSVRLLGWLASQTFEVVHFGDYDPVGLQEYLRLKKTSGSRANLYVPENLRELVRLYGKPDLLRDSTAVLSGLRQQQDEMVKVVLQCLEDFGSGLEQEILWADGRL